MKGVSPVIVSRIKKEENFCGRHSTMVLGAAVFRSCMGVGESANTVRIDQCTYVTVLRFQDSRCDVCT